MLKNLRKLYGLVILERRDAVGAVFLVLVMFVNALLEAVGIGIIMPFIALLERPSVMQESSKMRWLGQVTGVDTHFGMIALYGGVLAGVFFLKSAYSSFASYWQQRFVYARQVALARRLLSAYLEAPYTFHLRRNSADLIQNIAAEVHTVFTLVLLPFCTFLIELLTVLVIGVVLIAIEPKVIPTVGITVGILSFIGFRLLHRGSAQAGAQKIKDQAEALKWVQQGLGGVKEAQVIGVQDYFVKAYARSLQRYCDASAKQRILSTIPRYALETVGVLMVVGVSLMMLWARAPRERIVPVLGVLAVAAVRLMPSAAKIIAAIADMAHFAAAVDVIDADFHGIAREGARRSGTRSKEGALAIERELRLVDVSYTYPSAPQPALSGVNLTIARGESVAFIGPSGAGKSTLADVIIGVLRPTRGYIEVDGERVTDDRLRRWMNGIGYIPQQIYLIDDTLRCNVAYGVPADEIDEERVKTVIRAAQLESFVESLPDGLDTFVGERGVRLSGGQRQRIGIARALYQRPSVLVLDEATSALDGSTEREIVESIEALRGECTMIVIAHRLSTVRSCDRLVVLEKGAVAQIGTWKELLETNSELQRFANLTEQRDPKPVDERHLSH